MVARAHTFTIDGDNDRKLSRTATYAAKCSVLQNAKRFFFERILMPLSCSESADRPRRSFDEIAVHSGDDVDADFFRARFLTFTMQSTSAETLEIHLLDHR